MGRFAVELLPAAEAEIRDAFLWYFERSPIAADAFRAEALDAVDSLQDRADLWGQDGNGFRKCHLSRFPFTIHYELMDTRVIVYAVAHQRRKPGYWRLTS